MKKLSVLTLAVVAMACASAFAAAPPKDGVKDPESGITLHPPKHDASAPAGTKQQKFADEVKAAMRRVEAATKKGVQRAGDALHDVARNDKS